MEFFPLKHSESQPSKPPKGLSREGARWWRRLTTEYEIGDEAGRLILMTAMEAFDRMRQAQAVLAKDGLVVTDRFAQKKAHPLCTVERDSRAQMLAALKALNLDVEPLRNTPGRPGGQ